MVRSHTKNEFLTDSKIILEWEPLRSLWTERPRIGWLGDVCDGMKVMNVKNWEELALQRKAWNDLVEKAKTHKGL
jgi:hypothetical protein